MGEGVFCARRLHLLIFLVRAPITYWRSLLPAFFRMMLRGICLLMLVFVCIPGFIVLFFRKFYSECVVGVGVVFDNSAYFPVVSCTVCAIVPRVLLWLRTAGHPMHARSDVVLRGVASKSD